MTSYDWPNLRPQIALSERLFGKRGAVLFGNWFDKQMERISDTEFARLFSDHIDLPEVVSGDYNHRLVQSKNGRLIGGIRFFGGNLERPFVEIIAHDFQDNKALRDCVLTEWSVFKPLHLRLLTSNGTVLPPCAHVDMTIYASRFRDMTPPDNRVTLARFEDVEEAVSIVSERYAELAQADPTLARNISAADEADLKDWHDKDQLRAIHTELEGSEATVGLFAAAPGVVEWIEGDEVNEEVVAVEYSGHGFAASAQVAWTGRPEVDPDRLLVGTIDRFNVASRRSAEKAGRAAVLDYVFMQINK